MTVRSGLANDGALGPAVSGVPAVADGQDDGRQPQVDGGPAADGWHNFHRNPVFPPERAVLISATVRNTPTQLEVFVRTGDGTHALAVPAKPCGKGSAVNGGEFLMLALATCYCNDLYREAERMHVPVDAVVVEASADFPGIGLAATDIRYAVEVSSPAPAEEIAELVRQTDAVAEVHNTIRAGAAVSLTTRA